MIGDWYLCVTTNKWHYVIITPERLIDQPRSIVKSLCRKTMTVPNNDTHKIPFVKERCKTCEEKRYNMSRQVYGRA